MIVADTLRRLQERGFGLANRHLLEVASVITGRRRFARLVIAGSAVKELRAELAAMGLAVGEPEVRNEVVRTEGYDRFCRRRAIQAGQGSGGIVAVIVSNDVEDARKGQRIDDFGDSAEIGAMLGYPECCVSAYARIERGADWVASLWELAGRGAIELPRQANCLAGLFSELTIHGDFFPCRLGCPLAVRWNAAIEEAGIAVGLETEVAEGRSVMRGSFVLLDGVAVRLVRKGNRYRADEVSVRDGRDARWASLLGDRAATYRDIPGGLVLEPRDGPPLRIGGSIVEFT